MKTLPSVDAVVVGGGFTGLLIAKELGSRTSMSLAVLERGDAHSRAEYANAMDEVEYKARFRNVQDYSKETVTLRHSAIDLALPVRQPATRWPVSGMGGLGEYWGGTCPRYSPDAFELYSATVARYGKARLPEDCSIQDYGISWKEIEPYYTRVERMLGISGKAGNLNGKLTDGGNIFEGPRSEEYPTPPMMMPNFSTIFADAAKSLGYHPYPNPAATISTRYTNDDGITRLGCTYCGFCDGYPCMINAKAQPTNTLLPVIQKLPRVAIRTGCWVKRVVHEGGKARGVIYIDATGEEILQPAELVILAAWTMNNVRLLLLSRIGQPYDAKTGKGQVGRNLTAHINIVSAQVFLNQPMNRFMGGASAGIRFGDLDGDLFERSGLEFLRGGNFGAMSSGYQPITTFGTIPLDGPPQSGSTWGSAWKKAAIENYDRWGFINFMGETLAYRGNFMDLDPTYTDQFGDPVLRLTLNWRSNERKMMDWAVSKSVEVGKAMGARAINPFQPFDHFDITRTSMTHTQGGALMGTSPDHSLVNTYQQMWEMPNLFVVGQTALPQIASGNPTPTILAITSRTADAIVERYVKSRGPLA